jgi:hypothetical protein
MLDSELDELKLAELELVELNENELELVELELVELELNELELELELLLTDELLKLAQKSISFIVKSIEGIPVIAINVNLSISNP